MSEPASSSRKNRKRYFQGGGGSAMKKGKRNRLEPGVKGFLATSSNRDEAKCVRELHALLNDFGDRLYGEKNDLETCDPKSDSEKEDDDVEAALKKERDALLGKVDASVGDDKGDQSIKSKFTNRFTTMDTSVANNVFVATNSNEFDPCALVHSILADIKETKRHRSRFIQRLLPVEITCKAYVDDIERALIANKELLSKHFSSSDQPTYAIFYKRRNNQSLKKEDIFRVINELISCISPLAKVDLEKPKKAILVEVLQTVACISIVDDYIDFCKYNLHMIGKQE